MKRLNHAMQLLLLIAIRCYQLTLGPLLRAASGQARLCRFEPSCSHYAIESLKIHGPCRGLWLALKRISRCHPWGDWGYDPVPPAPGSPASPQTEPKQPSTSHSHLKSEIQNVRS